MAKYPNKPSAGVKKLLGGSSTSGPATKETKRKVEQESCYNPRQAASPSGTPPKEYAKHWRYSEQPSSGE